MKEKQIIADIQLINEKTTIVNKLGLHARAASVFVKEAQKYSAAVTVTKEDVAANGKSIISMMMLQAPKGSLICLSCDGEDEQEAMDALIQTIGNRFGENE